MSYKDERGIINAEIIITKEFVMKPIILITGGISSSVTGKPQWALNHSYHERLVEAGAIPMMALSPECVEEYADLADGLLLSGGRDVEPQRYHRETKFDSVVTDPKRDEFEWALIKAFEAKKKPIFGICRGLQTMNTYFGGTLYQDIPSELGGNHSGGVNHMLKMKADSILGNLFGESMVINSYHHQAIETLAPGFVATAWSDAGGHEIVEAIEHETLPYFAVQWHPESMAGTETNPVECVDSKPIFHYFVEQCRSKE